MARKKKFNIGELKEKLVEAKERITELEENFEKKVEEHPIQAVAIAFGVGVVSGALRDCSPGAARGALPCGNRVSVSQRGVPFGRSVDQPPLGEHHGTASQADFPHLE